MYGLEVLLLVQLRCAGVCPKDTLRDFYCHIAVSALSGRRADFFVIKEHDHVNFSVVTLLSRQLGMSNQCIKRAERGSQQLV